MKNIINIIKYNFAKYNMGVGKVFYIIGLILILLVNISTFTRIPYVSEILSLINVGFVATFLVVNFITSIVIFYKQVSREEGRLIFTFPIKAWEFIIAKFTEFIIIQGGFALIVYLFSLISVNSVSSLVRLVSISTAFGTIVGYIFIASFTVIFSSYFNNAVLVILAVILGGGFIQSIVEGIIWAVTRVFPYVYMRVGTFIEVDIINTLLSLAWTVALVYMAIYHLDKKLDII